MLLIIASTTAGTEGGNGVCIGEIAPEGAGDREGGGGVIDISTGCLLISRNILEGFYGFYNDEEVIEWLSF